MVEIETMSLGKALIATDLGFSEEAIIDGYNGLKFCLGDLNGFVSEIIYLWNNPAQCNEMGKNARMEYENKYQSEKNFLELDNIYRSVCVATCKS